MDAQNPQPPPEHVAELAEGCVRYVREAVSLELDYSPETLPILDHYVRERLQGDASEEIIQLMVPAAGAYFGEVVRRSLPSARWHCPQRDYRHYALEFERVFLHFNPMGVAVEIIAGEDASGWNAHYAVLEEAQELVDSSLEHAGPVRPEDYYTFSIRHETLEQVVAVLAGLESQREAPRHFGADVYQAARGEDTGQQPS